MVCATSRSGQYVIASTIKQYKRIVDTELLCTTRRSLLDAEPEFSPFLEAAAIMLETSVDVPRSDKPFTNRIRRTTYLIRDEELIDAITNTGISLR